MTTEKLFSYGTLQYEKVQLDTFGRKLSGKNKRTHQIHAFQTGSTQIKRHLDFRDYLIAHPDIAKEYEKLKIMLAKKFPNNRRAYVEGKQGFINSIAKEL